MWWVDCQGDVWRLNPSTDTWTKQVTTGIKPNSAATFAIDEAKQLIVGWAGFDNNRGVPVNQTYVLDLATNVWRLGPAGAAPAGLTAGMASPAGPSGNYGSWTATGMYDATYGPVWVGFGVDSAFIEVWQFKAGGATPPPTQFTLTMAVSP